MSLWAASLCLPWPKGQAARVAAWGSGHVICRPHCAQLTRHQKFLAHSYERIRAEQRLGFPPVWPSF